MWTIRVRSARESDSGAYECQVNTLPSGGDGARRRIFTVTVSRASVRIAEAEQEQEQESEGGGGGVLYLESGSRLRLTCVVRAGPELAPQFVMWYRDDRIVSYSDGEGEDVEEVSVDFIHIGYTSLWGRRLIGETQ